jgi:hypothetical protein
VTNAVAVNYARGITTREQFQKNLVMLKQIADAGINSPEEGKDAMTKADALRAWASFDKRLTDEEKKEANRAQTRIMLAISELAAREQPIRSNGNKGSTGPAAYLMREFGVKKHVADRIRRLVTMPDVYAKVLEDGRPYGACKNIFSRLSRSTMVAWLTYLRRAAPRKTALAVPSTHWRVSATMARDAIGWLQTYVETLETLIAREKSGLKTEIHDDQ